MRKIMCSLCRKTGSAARLDMDDPLFGSYVRVVRRLGLSRHTEDPGICGACMPKYLSIKAAYARKKLFYGALAVAFLFAYAYLTGNLLMALLLSLFICSLSLVSYCPPLKEEPQTETREGEG